MFKIPIIPALVFLCIVAVLLACLPWKRMLGIRSRRTTKRRPKLRLANPPTVDDRMAIAGWDTELLTTSTGVSAADIAEYMRVHPRNGSDSRVADAISPRVKGRVNANDVAITRDLMKAGRIIGGKRRS